jgi:hypothetical protein
MADWAGAGADGYAELWYIATSTVALGDYNLFIGTNDPVYVFPYMMNTLNISQGLGQRGTLSVQIWDPDSTHHFYKGEYVRYEYFGNNYFTGFIDSVSKAVPADSGIVHSINAIDMTYALDKRRVICSYIDPSPTSTKYLMSTGGYSSQLTCFHIVHDVLDNYLTQEGISAGTISSGATLQTASYNYVKASDVLDSLAEQSGYIWGVDNDGVLDFKHYQTDDLGWTIGSSQMLKGSIRYQENAPRYRNIQYVVGGINKTTSLSALEHGDGRKQSFLLPYFAMEQPTVYMCSCSSVTTGTVKTCGIKGIDTTQDWFWNKFSPYLIQLAGATPMTATQYLRVVYVGGTNAVVRMDSPTEIMNTKTMEVIGSGFVEDAIYSAEESLYQDNSLLATNMLSRYSTLVNTLSFRTLEEWFQIGKTVSVTVPELGVVKSFLVNNINIEEKDGAFMEYTIDCLEGPDWGGWSRFFQDQYTRSVEKNIREGCMLGDLLPLTTTISETFTWSESVVETTNLCLMPCSSLGSLFPSTSDEGKYPC